MKTSAPIQVKLGVLQRAENGGKLRADDSAVHTARIRRCIAADLDHVMIGAYTGVVLNQSTRIVVFDMNIPTAFSLTRSSRVGVRRSNTGPLAKAGHSELARRPSFPRHGRPTVHPKPIDIEASCRTPFNLPLKQSGAMARPPFRASQCVHRTDTVSRRTKLLPHWLA